MIKNFVLTITLIIFICSCQHKTKRLDKLLLHKTDFKVLEGWKEENKADALIAFKKSCAKLLKTKKISHSGYLNFADNYRAWEDTCNLSMLVNETDEDEIQEFFEENFRIYKVTDLNQDLGLFTGYYEVMLNGSLKKDNIFKYPIFKMPPTWILNKKKPFFSRKEIENGALEGLNLEIVYTDDPIKLYFLHIQGSGVIFLKEGGLLNIGYAGKNGHSYGSIGKYLIEKNIITKENMSAKKIMEWLENCPTCFKKLAEVNPSYVFFDSRIERAIGAQGVELTAEKSLAVDPKFIPLGIPIWLETNINNSLNPKTEKIFNHLMITQDTGGAIKGSIRGDIFFGAGPIAEEFASHTKHMGQYYLLLPIIIEIPKNILSSW